MTLVQALLTKKEVKGIPVRSSKPSCRRCGRPLRSGASPFCCVGCEFASQISPQKGKEESFEYLDDPEVQKTFLQKDSAVARFYLEGVVCGICIGDIEGLVEKIPAAREIVYRVGESVAEVSMLDLKALSSVARGFRDLGFQPHPVVADQAAGLRQHENHLTLLRLGVSAFCASNIMIFALAVYSGADGFTERLFTWLSFGLSLPVVLFSAVPFYKSSLQALKSFRLSIDVPIVLAVMVSFAVSLPGLWTGGHTYFDSLAMLIFLMLAGRYILMRAQQAAWQNAHVGSLLVPAMADRVTVSDGFIQRVAVSNLVPGDVIQVRAGEVIPVDGMVFSGKSQVDAALLTGESRPQNIEKGGRVYAGCSNLSNLIEIRVDAYGASTRISRILEAAAQGRQKRSKTLLFSDAVASVLTPAVIGIGTVFFAIFSFIDFEQAVFRTLALFIVTCPCALAIVAPLTMSFALGILAKNGILVRSAEALEKLAQVRTWFLDKTGTITLGKPGVLNWTWLEPHEKERKETLDAVLALEKRSNHPSARALVEFVQREAGLRPLPPVSDFIETVGRGVRGSIDETLFEIRGLRSSEVVSLFARDEIKNVLTSTVIGVFRESRLVSAVEISDIVRADAQSTISAMRERGMKVHLLSGDSKTTVDAVGEILGFSPSERNAELSPEAKAEVVRQSLESKVKKSKGLVAVVGDGVNDAAAMAEANIGIAMRESIELSFRAADLYLSKPGIGGVMEAHRTAVALMKVHRGIFVFSLTYNVIGAVAALTGKVSPLFAAILMPVSAVTVFGVALFLMKRVGRN